MSYPNTRVKAQFENGGKRALDSRVRGDGKEASSLAALIRPSEGAGHTRQASAAGVTASRNSLADDASVW